MADVQEIVCGEQFSNMSLLPDAIQESDSSLQDISQDVPPTLLALNNYRLPTEIFSQIISHLVPDGLQISNDPACDSDMTTIRALLKTSIKVKHEMLHQIFRYPLRIHISNGKICGCTRIIRGKSTLLLKKISHLPLYRWTSATISFAPTSQEESCLPNQRRYSGPRIVIPPLTFDCYDTRRQSGTLKTNFIFHDPTHVDPVYEGREIPVWEISSVLSLVDAWRWTSFQGPFQQIKLPPTMAFCLWDRGSELQQAAFPHDPAIFVAKLREDFSMWWQRLWMQMKNNKAARVTNRANLAHYLLECKEYTEIDWYLSKAPLIQHSTTRQILGFGVLRLDVSEVDSGCGQESITHWKGDFIASDN